MKKLMESWRGFLKESQSFSFNVIEDEFDGGPTVEFDGIDKSFEEMMQDLEGKTLDFDDGEGPFQFSVELFGSTEDMIVNGVAPDYIQMWAQLNGLQATRAGGHYEEGVVAERDWQDESDKIKGHPRRKTRVLDTGANKETGGGEGHQKRDKKRGKSAPPGAGVGT